VTSSGAAASTTDASSTPEPLLLLVELLPLEPLEPLEPLLPELLVVDPLPELPVIPDARPTGVEPESPQAIPRIGPTPKQQRAATVRRA
jgi:hypothetical protein